MPQRGVPSSTPPLIPAHQLVSETGAPLISDLVDENGKPLSGTSGNGQRGLTPTTVSAPALANADPTAVPDILPSPRTLMRTGGATVGGLIGAPGGPPGAVAGGALGAVGGDALYQLLEAFAGQRKTPSTPQQVLLEAGEGGLEGALQEGTGVAVEKVVPKLLEKGMARTTTKIISPAGLSDKAIAKEIAGPISKELPLATSAEDLLEKFNVKLDDANKALDAAFAKVPKGTTFDTAPILKNLQDSQRALYVNGKPTPGTGQQLKAYQELIDWFKANPQMSIDALRKNRQLWDQLVNWGRLPGTTQPAREAVYEEGANLLRGLINGSSKDIADANYGVHLWKGARDLLEKAETRGVNKSHLGDSVAASVGALTGAMHGGSAEAAVLGAGAVLTKRIMQEPAWRTATVAARRQALNLLQSKGGGALAEAVGILTAGTERGVRGLANPKSE
jgi:hypothetical protein